MWRTRVTDILGIRYPILQGGMRTAANGELASAVSNVGGLGVVGQNPGSPLENQLNNLRDHVRRAKSITANPVAVNVVLSSRHARSCIDLAIEEKVRIVVTVQGDPKPYVKYMKDAGITVISLARNVEDARKAEEAGVDIVVASGFEAGGIIGPDQIPTFVLVPLICDAVHIPVVAAGGIGDARGFVAALALGAEGVQMGTVFLSTTECHVHPAFKEAIVRATDCDTVVTRINYPPSQRCLRTALVNRLEEMDRHGASAEEIRRFIGFGKSREALMLGDMAGGEPACGIVAAMVSKVVSAGEVVDGIIKGAEPILSRCNRFFKN